MGIRRKFSPSASVIGEAAAALGSVERDERDLDRSLRVQAQRRSINAQAASQNAASNARADARQDQLISQELSNQSRLQLSQIQTQEKFALQELKAQSQLEQSQLGFGQDVALEGFRQEGRINLENEKLKNDLELDQTNFTNAEKRKANSINKAITQTMSRKDLTLDQRLNTVTQLRNELLPLGKGPRPRRQTPEEQFEAKSFISKKDQSFWVQEPDGSFKQGRDPKEDQAKARKEARKDLLDELPFDKDGNRVDTKITPKQIEDRIREDNGLPPLKEEEETPAPGTSDLGDDIDQPQPVQEQTPGQEVQAAAQRMPVPGPPNAVQNPGYAFDIGVLQQKTEELRRNRVEKAAERAKQIVDFGDPDELARQRLVRPGGIVAAVRGRETREQSRLRKDALRESVLGRQLTEDERDLSALVEHEETARLLEQRGLTPEDIVEKGRGAGDLRSQEALARLPEHIVEETPMGGQFINPVRARSGELFDNMDADETLTRRTWSQGFFAHALSPNAKMNFEQFSDAHSHIEKIDFKKEFAEYERLIKDIRDPTIGLAGFISRKQRPAAMNEIRAFRKRKAEFTNSKEDKRISKSNNKRLSVVAILDGIVNKYPEIILP